MKAKITLLFIAVSLTLWAQEPPQAPVKVVTDEYFGTSIDDPYRYMEDMKDPAVVEWFKGQGDYSAQVLGNINGRDELIAKFKEMDQRRSSRIYNLSITENDHYFYLKMTPEDETGKLYTRRGYEGAEEFLFDPSAYKTEEGQQYTVQGVSPNKDGSLLAFSVAANGSESSIIMVMDMKTKTLLPDTITDSWGGVAWAKDEKSFTYGKYNSNDITDQNRQLNTKNYYHKVGDDSANDIVIFHAPEHEDLKITPEEIPFVYYDKDAKMTFLWAYTVERNAKVYVSNDTDFSDGVEGWKQIVKREDQIESVSTDNENFYLRTTKDAPNYKILTTPLSNKDFSKATEMIAEDKAGVLTSFAITAKGYYYTKRYNGVETKVFRMDGIDAEPKMLELPFTAGSAALGTKGVNQEDLWITMSGWTKNTARYKYNPHTGEYKFELLSSVAEFPEFEGIVAKEIMIPSHDGVEVPVSLIYHKDMKKDGNNPLMMYGYGSYGISITPYFSTTFLSWVREGGVIAIAHVRGGGELGEAWHKAGQKSTKPNTWKDFIATAEYLHKEKISQPSKTAIFGGSAGGILVGRSMTERPDLFGVAVPAVGSMNPVRGEETPNGPVNAPEFGTVKDEAEFKALYEMDSYLHLKDGVEYPATLVTTGMNDRRVVAWQPGKFTARLQAANGSDNPILFRVDYESGHGSDAKTKQFEEYADIFSFAFWQMGHPNYQSIQKSEQTLDK